jgi:hypothetical protein
VPQRVVIDQVFVTQRNTKHALSDQRHLLRALKKIMKPLFL